MITGTTFTFSRPLYNSVAETPAFLTSLSLQIVTGAHNAIMALLFRALFYTYVLDVVRGVR